MEVYGQLEVAGLQRLTSNPAGANLFIGRMWFRTDTNKFHVYDGSSILEFADLTSAQTFQQKTLAGATISDFLQFTQQGSTPALPAAGSNRIYFKNDGTAYTLDSAGNELPLGSGSGGSKNYFEDSDSKVDSTVGNWLTDDGAGSPSGGLTLALTAVAGELLEGNNSLKISKDAADRNGHFVKVLSKTIDPSDRGRPNYGSFEFRPLTGYVSSDLVWEVYDVTNATVLYSGVASDLELLNSRGRFNWVTYLAEDTEQVEFRLKVDNTNTNAFDVVVDEFTFGPVAILNAPIVTEWQEYSLVIGGSGGTPPTPNPDYQQANWRRVGDSMEITFNYLQSVAGASGAGTSYTFSLPPGYQMDAAKWYPGFGNGTQGSCGTAIVQSTSRGVQEGWIQPLNSTQFIIYTGDAVDNHAIMGAAYNPFGDATIRISFRAVVPIVGWGAGAVLSGNELSQQTMRASIYLSGDQAINNANQNVVLFDTVDFDKFGLFSAVDNGFKIQKDGDHKVTVKVNVSGLTADEQFIGRILKNGIEIDRVVDRSPNGDVPIRMTRTFPFVKGDIITAALDSGGDTSYTARGGISDSVLQIEFEQDNTLLGVIKNEEYLETVIASSTTTSLANTETDVTGSELEIPAGLWDIGYDLDGVTRNIGGVNNTQFGSIMVTDSLNNRIEGMESLTGGVLAPNAEINSNSSKQKRIYIPDTITLKIRIASLDAAATGTFGIRASGNVTGSLPGDDSVSRFWARRVK